MKYLVFFTSLLCFFSLHSDEIVVNLNASSSLEPVYVELNKSASSFDSAYLKKIEEVFCFDFNHNGKTKVISKKEALNTIQGSFVDKNFQVTFPFKVEVTLSGTLSEDRRKVHSVSDALFKAMFHEKGIASSRILYIVRNKEGHEQNATKWKSEVWEADYDGENRQQITKEEGLCVTPAHIPHKQAGSFLYATYKTGQSKITLISLNGSFGKKKVVQLRGNQWMPAYSPKNHLLAFVSDATGNPEVFIQNFDPEKEEVCKPWQATFAPQGAQGSPTFSPDGRKMAFVSNKDGTPRIYIMETPAPSATITTLKPVLITKMARDNTSPSWSPDGQKIAYSAMTKGTRQIWIYDLASKKEIMITEGAGHKENPAWAPNSSHLLFDVTINNNSDLYLTHIQQKEMVKIGKGQGDKRFPVWMTFSS